MSSPLAPRRPRARIVTGPAFAVLGAAIAFGAPAKAQVRPTPAPPAELGEVLDRADSLYRAGLHEESLALLEERVRTGGEDYRIRVAAARDAVVLGIVASYADRGAARAWLERGVEHGERARALEPQGEEGRYWSLAANGRLGMLEGGTARAGLAVTVDTAARALVRLAPRHAGAHNALGRLYFEVASLSWLERRLAGLWLGGDLMGRATWENAERELRLATELDPANNLYWLDLGALYVKRGRLSEARPVLEAALGVPLEIPAQGLFRDDARRLLEEVERRER